ncbi:MAG: YfiR family protein [Thermodesulfovibrionales bacterium]|nr:YfiR family protein [Thermodesulfovibrionales bacterium]
MITRITILLVLIVALLLPFTSWSLDDELRLEAVFLGRFASFVEIPNSASKTQFIITLIDKNPYGSFIYDFYKDKTIHGKPVLIRHVKRIDDIGICDMLFINVDTNTQRQAIIDYALKNSILTVSNSRGFAESGGIIQINFVNRKPTIKINYDAAVKSGIKVSAPLLSLATVLTGGRQ